MSDFELMYLFNDATNVVLAYFSLYLSIVFAFLVCSYLVADKLTRHMAITVVILYSVTTLFTGYSLNRFAQNTTNLGLEIMRLIESGQSQLTWTTLAQDIDTKGGLIFYPVAIILVVLISYFGSLLFFFYQRRQGLMSV